MNSTIKTTVLLAALTGIFLAAGYAIAGLDGALFALVFAAIFNFFSYWFSDSLVLRMYDAQPITRAHHPVYYDLVRDLTMKARLPMPQLYIIALPSPNAFATGRNPEHSAIAVSKTLLDLLTKDELEGVLAHEIAHIHNRDILISSLAATISAAISYLAQIAYWGGFAHNRDDRDDGNFFGVLAFAILTPFIATLLHLAISRSREFQADKTGVQMSGNPAGLASALEKLHMYSKGHPLVGQPKHEATAHMFIVNPFKNSMLMNLFMTHPPMAERIRRLREMQ